MPINKHSTITLNVLSAPLLFLAAILLASSSGIVSFSQASTQSPGSDNPEVLSESDAQKEKSEEEIKAYKEKLRAEKAKMIEAQKRAKEASRKEQEKAREQVKKQLEVQNKLMAPVRNEPKELDVDDTDDDSTDQPETAPTPEPTRVSLPIDIKVNGANLSNPSVLNKMRVEINKELKSIPGVEGKITKVELKESVENGEYKGIVAKEEKMFGLFNISVPVEVSVDSDTGEVKIEEPSVWAKILDAVSY